MSWNTLLCMDFIMFTYVSKVLLTFAEKSIGMKKLMYENANYLPMTEYECLCISEKKIK